MFDLDRKFLYTRSWAFPPSAPSDGAASPRLYHRITLVSAAANPALWRPYRGEGIASAAGAVFNVATARRLHHVNKATTNVPYLRVFVSQHSVH